MALTTRARARVHHTVSLSLTAARRISLPLITKSCSLAASSPALSLSHSLTVSASCGICMLLLRISFFFRLGGSDDVRAHSSAWMVVQLLRQINSICMQADQQFSENKLQIRESECVC